MSSTRDSIEQAASLMADFAERTGLGSAGPGQRYLWTDAFAVCNFLALARATGEKRYVELALGLVDRVHHGLGRYRSDDSRTGWISGLDEQEAELHPTRGGLRIGKKLPERRSGEPLDEPLEWDRDGQYFHYLTRWMHALDQVSGATRDPRFNLWARELAQVAHSCFVQGAREPGGRPRMVWKMSTDLSRPLVPSMGQHDALDGFITCVQLETTASLLAGAPDGPRLALAAADYSKLLEVAELRTADPLGLGGLLADACRVAQLIERGARELADLLLHLMLAARDGLSQYARHGEWQQPAYRRLAFRELGLSIGLSAVEPIKAQLRAEHERFTDHAELAACLAALVSHRPLGATIGSFWLEPEHRRVPSWSKHRDINEVMLATSVLPEGYLLFAHTPKG